MSARGTIRRRVFVLAVALALAGSLGTQPTTTVRAVGPGDVTPPSLEAAFAWSGPITPITEVFLIWGDLLGESEPLDVGDFDVKVDNVSVGLDAVAFTHHGYIDPDNAVTITTVFLTNPVPASPSSFTLSYTRPPIGGVVDLAGNFAETSLDAPVNAFDFTSFEVVLPLVDGNYGPDHIGVLFADPILASSVDSVPLSAFEVTRNGSGPITPTSKAIFPGFSGRILDLGLPVSFRSGDAATIVYNAPGAGGIANLNGTTAPSTLVLDVAMNLVARDAVPPTSVPSSGSVTTDALEPGPTSQDPVATTVTVPNASTVAIDEGLVGLPSPSTEFTFIGETVDISVSPAATPENPIAIDFAIDASVLQAAGATEASVELFRDGSLILPCTGSPGTAIPNDPCIASRVAVPGSPDPLQYALLRVYTSHASRWNIAVRNPYVWTGFRQPVDNPPIVNSANAGKAIPVKFTLGGDRGLNIFQPGYPLSERVDCLSGVPMDDVEVTSTAGSSSLAYDAATGVYTYVWKSVKAWSSSPGGPCRRLVLGFVDGTNREASFKFR